MTTVISIKLRKERDYDDDMHLNMDCYFEHETV